MNLSPPCILREVIQILDISPEVWYDRKVKIGVGGVGNEPISALYLAGSYSDSGHIT